MGIRERLQRERAARRGNQEGTPPSRQRRVGKWAGVFLALIALLTLYTQVLSPLTVPVVETAIPSAQRLNYAISYKGVVESKRRRYVLGQAGLRVERLLVAPGDAVQEGQPLLRYDRTELRALLDTEARALEKLRIQQKQLQRGWNPDGLASLQLDLDAQAAVVGRLEALLQDKGVLYSPLTALVVSLAVQPGDRVGDEPVAILCVPEDGFRVRGSLAADQAARLSVGDEATLTATVAATALEAPGTVSSLAGSDGERAEIVVDLEQAPVTPGLVCQIRIQKQSPLLGNCLPISALRRDGTGDYVLALRREDTVWGRWYTAERLPVTVLERTDSLAAVSLHGDEAGDEIIVSASRALAPGDRVRRAAP